MTDTCPKCKDGGLLGWFSQNTVPTGQQQNRLNTDDVECIFVLGCGLCNETLKVLKPADIVQMLQTKPEPFTRDDVKRIFSEAIEQVDLGTLNVTFEDAASVKHLHNIVDAWEALPGGRQVRNEHVELWLRKDMAPAINAIRDFLKREKPKA